MHRGVKGKKKTTHLLVEFSRELNGKKAPSCHLEGFSTLNSLENLKQRTRLKAGTTIVLPTTQAVLASQIVTKAVKPKIECISTKLKKSMFGGYFTHFR